MTPGAAGGRKLKVYGTTDMVRGGKQVRIVVAATSKAKARLLFSPQWKNYHSLDDITETGNPAEIRAALSEPGAVFWCPLDDASKPMKKRIGDA